MKIVLYLLFAVLYLLVIFFGLGPVLFADGSRSERLVTLAVVLVILALLTLGLRAVMKRLK
ncbi:hypothetical protein [Paenibacillus sp. NFR01]|uniref:DUF6954 family protein n=1 Tax=Paenibacillus sp. NFR01 TaxID=1566279 RepID=UPI0008CE97E8|nr:hypothetical protein [Paenibacillus sp. NFR01]SES98281.1 hypothetical protein SAMN03159358_0448 [Paenibacillus sp. NFR01]